MRGAKSYFSDILRDTLYDENVVYEDPFGKNDLGSLNEGAPYHRFGHFLTLLRTLDAITTSYLGMLLRKE